MKAYKETVRKYYKYSYTSWTRPNISSNGTLGGNSFACSGGVSNPWQCFDGNSGTFGQFYANNESRRTLIFYNPTPIKIYSVGFTYYPSAYIKQATFYGSNDNSTWTEITSFTNSANSNTVNFPSNVNAYKYYKLYITSANGHDGGGGYYIADIYEMTFNAGVQTVIEGTESDYDFYKDIDEYKIHKETIRKYYKYGTTPNVNIVGSPTITDGIISGFSSSNYASTPSAPSNVTSYEIGCKFTTGNLNGVQKGILANYSSNRDTPQLFIQVANRIQFLHPTSSSAWSTAIEGVPTTANTTYWIKVTWNGNTVSMYYKMNKEDDYTLGGTASSSTINWTAPLGIGIDTPSYPFDGSIDLKETYVKINDQDWWHGTLAEESTSSDYDYYKDIDVYKAFNV